MPVRVISAFLNTGECLVHPTSSLRIRAMKPTQLFSDPVNDMPDWKCFLVDCRRMPFGQFDDLEMAEAGKRPNVIFAIDVPVVLAPKTAGGTNTVRRWRGDRNRRHWRELPIALTRRDRSGANDGRIVSGPKAHHFTHCSLLAGPLIDTQQRFFRMLSHASSQFGITTPTKEPVDAGVSQGLRGNETDSETLEDAPEAKLGSGVVSSPTDAHKGEEQVRGRENLTTPFQITFKMGFVALKYLE
ncbi:MAG: hypothetical protein C0449_07860 [Polaromonas sp.]|nr:hypothetical protein [Polaromonas sp.]